MALQPKFELLASGNGTTSTKDDWYDVLSGTGFSPIPSGKRVWLGIAVYGADDKDLRFEVRPNKATKSAGTLADTDWRGTVSAKSGNSEEDDYDKNGTILVTAPVSAESTGVEKLWLRVTSGSNVSGTFFYNIYFTEY